MKSYKSTAYPSYGNLIFNFLYSSPAKAAMKSAGCSAAHSDRQLDSQTPRSLLAALFAVSWAIPFLLANYGGHRQPFFLGLCNSSPAYPPRPSRIDRAVLEPRQGGPGLKRQGSDPRLLTFRISKAECAAEILELVAAELDNSNFNDFHLSAAFSRLAKFSQKRQLRRADLHSPVWPRLVAQLRTMIREDMLAPRMSANVFWAHGELYKKVESCSAPLVAGLLLRNLT